MISKVIQSYLKEHGGQGTATVPPEVMEAYLASCKSAIEEMFSSYTSKFPTVSDLGKDELSMWARKNIEGVKESLEPRQMMTFWQGKVVEALLIALMRMSGVDVVSEQERVYLNDEHIPDPIRGRMDVVVTSPYKEKVIVDIKIAHSESYTNKWKSHETLTAEDSYGYNSQGGAYSRAAQIPFAGWLVFNKDTCEIKDVEVTDKGVLESALNASLTRMDKAYGQMPTLPEEPEFYRGEATGNRRVPPYFARQPYARKLWSNATFAKRGAQTIIYTHFEGIKIPGVRLEEK